MQLEHALLRIAEIREQVEHAQVFRGYRAQVAAASSLLAIVAAVCQRWFVPASSGSLIPYVEYWSTVAGLAVAITGVDLLLRWTRDVTGRERVRIIAALRALLPCLVTGALVSTIIVRQAPELGWLLPGLWAILFAQGVFASAPLLPTIAWWIGAYYVAAGLAVLAFADRASVPPAWTMVVTFGLGQLLAAIGLYLSLERRHVA